MYGPSTPLAFLMQGPKKRISSSLAVVISDGDDLVGQNADKVAGQHPNADERADSAVNKDNNKTSLVPNFNNGIAGKGTADYILCLD
ncbi:hypothetical protein ACHAPI_001658 [Fusarium lateritium]